MANEQEEKPGPPVVVLVSEDFFRQRICTTLQAVGHEAVVLPVDEDLDDFAANVLDSTDLGLVIDLEEEDFDALVVLPKLLDDARSDPWSIMAFCSHEREDLIEGATEMGVDVVPRSTFASNLVRLLQSFQS